MELLKSIFKPKRGVERVLDRCDRVAGAFGQNRGFVVIMTAMRLSAGITATGMVKVIDAVSGALR
jgi:hypothetical protein